jgi:hypothetical protein
MATSSAMDTFSTSDRVPQPPTCAVLVFSSASHFVRHCARLDSRPSSRHYRSLYVNGVAWPNLFQAPDANLRHHSRHTQPRDRGDEGEDQVRGYSPPLQGPPALPVRGHSADVQRLVPLRRNPLVCRPVSPPPRGAPQPVTLRPPPPAQPRFGLTSNATTPTRQRERRKKSAGPLCHCL